MDKDKNKGLADNHDGEFILNESGTSVTIDEDFMEEESKAGDDESADNNKKKDDEDK